MLYLTPPGPYGGAVRAAIRPGGPLAPITTPAQGNRLPDRVHWAADNGCFGGGWPGAGAWIDWLERQPYDRELCLWATAPDVVGDHDATLRRSLRTIDVVRRLGYRPAFVAQNGATPANVPWGDLAVLFLGGVAECPSCSWARPIGDDRPGCPCCRVRLREWKTGPAARDVAHQATDLGVPVHMGRVNTRARIDYARAIGCASVDGTTLTRSPENLPPLLGWLADAEAAASAGGALLDAGDLLAG